MRKTNGKKIAAHPGIRTMGRMLGSVLLATSIASFALVTMSGCKKKKDGYAAFGAPKETSKCTIGANHFEKTHAKFSTCCNPDTTPKMPMVDPTCGSGAAPVIASISGFMDSNARSNFSNTVASSLEAKKNPNSQNNQLAATAGNTVARPTGVSSVVSSGLAGLMGPDTGSGASASRGGGGGGGGGNSTFGTNVNTQPNAKLGSVETVANSENAAAGYTSSGGGARAGSGSSGSGFSLDSLFGGGASGAGGGKAGGDVNFGARSMASDSTMGTPDPEMYFAMMSREDNIFKVVERRYQSKAQQWALKDAREAVKR